MTILAIDDDLNDQMVITRAFRKNGVTCPIEWTSSWDEAMQRVLRIFYDYWMECEVPETDVTGKRLHTVSAGKLGARFVNQEDNDQG